MIADKYKGAIIAFRNDRMGARFLALLNTIRIARGYDLPYFLTWMTHGRASEELQAPTDIFDADWFETRFVSHADFKAISELATDTANLPMDSTAAALMQAAKGGQTFTCMNTELAVLPWEDAAQVAPLYADAISDLRFAPAILAAMKKVDALLSGDGTAFHIRRGDIIYDPVTSNQLWSNKYIPREFYEVLAQRLVAQPDARIMVFSDEPTEVTRLTALSPQILSPDSVLPDDLTLAQRDFMEIYAMSRCARIVGPPGSGFSIAAALIGHREIADIRDVLTEDENAQALDLLAQRLADRSDLFLSDGDIGQSMPFALTHLNEKGRAAEGLAMMRSYIDTGFHKVFAFRLLMEQSLLCGDTASYDDIIVKMRDSQGDPTLPGRLEQHWSEFVRLAGTMAAKAGNDHDATHYLAMSVWYNGTNQRTSNVIATLMDRGTLDPMRFAVPFDPHLARSVPAALGPRSGSETFYDASDPTDGLIFPPDLMAYDWQPFLGKTLKRGFATQAVVARAREILDIQFARAAPQGSIASARGVFTRVFGDLPAAMDFHRAALITDHTNPLFIKRIAETMLAIDPTDRTARILLEKAAALAPHQALYQAELAQCLWHQDEKSGAISMMQELCKDISVLPELPFLAARMLRQDGQSNDQALALVDQALATAPHVRRFMMMRINLLWDMKQPRDIHDMIAIVRSRFGDGGDLKAVEARLEKGS